MIMLTENDIKSYVLGKILHPIQYELTLSLKLKSDPPT